MVRHKFGNFTTPFYKQNSYFVHSLDHNFLLFLRMDILKPVKNKQNTRDALRMIQKIMHHILPNNLKRAKAYRFFIVFILHCVAIEMLNIKMNYAHMLQLTISIK